MQMYTISPRELLARRTHAAAASGPVMPEEPSEAVLSAMVLTKHGWAWVRPEPQADIYTAIRTALIAEQAGHEETTDA